jgi:trehalose 6-phosphate phosphatase
VTSALISEALAPLRSNRSRAAVLLDIDGTLAPIVEHAADASVPEATRQLLIAVVRRYALVACVSGRRASEARAMVSIGAISYLGSHGAELLRAGWTEAVLDPSLEDWARRIYEFGHEVDTPELRRCRVRIEDKGAIVAFHWRGARDEEAALAAIQAISAEAEAAGFLTHWGRKVLEIRPPVPIDKGQAVRELLRQTPVRAAVFGGDDATDLDVYDLLAELRSEGSLETAVCVGVRSDEGPPAIVERADIVVDGTQGFVQVLEVLAGPA